MKALAALGLGTFAAAALAAGPQVWTPPALSTADYEATPSFTPDGHELYYMSADPAFGRYSLRLSRCGGDGWQAPTRPSFARPLPVFDGDPHVSADGQWIYFISTRQNAGADDEDFDIWRARRLAAGGWGEPERLPEPVNSPASELLPRTTSDGRLVFGSDRPGGAGAMDIHEARQESSGTWTVRNLGAPVNTPNSEYEAEISQDGDMLVVVADRGDRSHLYVFDRDGDGWRERLRVPARADVFQVGPLLSPRKDRLLFAQAEPGRSGELMLIDLAPAPDRSWPSACATAPAGTR